jgi:hypothetical protein
MSTGFNKHYHGLKFDWYDSQTYRQLVAQTGIFASADSSPTVKLADDSAYLVIEPVIPAVTMSDNAPYIQVYDFQDVLHTKNYSPQE